MEAGALDRAVGAAARALAESGACAPRVMLHLATGGGLLPGRLEDAGRLRLGEAEGVPPAWAPSVLHHGRLRGMPAWLLEEVAPENPPAGPAWEAGFPSWLAAAAGARTLVHVSAGISTGALPAGTIAFARDHVNLSGVSPLTGLGESRLGPLFPDQSRLHAASLRRGALALCSKLGLSGAEGVAACTLGPSLDTPAELAWYARAGADVAVQGLAPPLIAAAHAGLRALAVVAVVAGAGVEMDVARLAAAASALAPALDDLLLGLADQLAAEPSLALEEP